jgi:hypothetical protein
MAAQIFRKLLLLIMVAGGLSFFAATTSQAAIEFDVAAIEAEIVTAVAQGADPVLAAKSAVAQAVRAIIAANPDYPGGQEALFADIFDALALLQITGLDDTDLFVAANHAMGISIDAALEAYEISGRSNAPEARALGPAGAGPETFSSAASPI